MTSQIDRIRIKAFKQQQIKIQTFIMKTDLNIEKPARVQICRTDPTQFRTILDTDPTKIQLQKETKSGGLYSFKQGCGSGFQNLTGSGLNVNI